MRVKFERILEEVKKLNKAGAHFSCLSAYSKKERFGIVYHFVKKDKEIDIEVVFDQNKKVPSIASIYPSAAFYEIEAHELFGIKFDKLPAEHLFLPKNWQKGKFPLRK